MFSYFTAAFLAVILPSALALYALVPSRARWVILLAFSYIFFAAVSGGLLIFLLLSTLATYVAALGMGRLQTARDNALNQPGASKKELKKQCKRRKRGVLAVAVIFNIGLLVALKYLGFFGECAAGLLSAFGISLTFDVPKIGIPIGISFYTLMAVSYCVDVYRETVCPDRHLGRLAVFLSFFPQIMEGPICRYGQTAQDLYAGKPLNRQNLYQGSLRMLVGIAKKIVVADRLNIIVKTIFNNYGSYDGSAILLGAVLYTVQLYFDFGGTIDVALGIAQMFNVKLPENFRQPFFSRTAGEFWQRWHITLGTFLRDYVYYPVSLSAPCKALTKRARKVCGNRYGPLLVSSIALFCVWMCNGLWHGAGSQYLFFGMYYFVLIVAGGLIEPAWGAFSQKHGINRNAPAYRAVQIARTLVIIVVGEMFFRANGLDAGISMFAQMITNFTGDAFASSQVLRMGLNPADFLIVGISVAAVLVLDILKECGKQPLTWAARQNGFVKWLLWVSIFCFFVVFGAYGYGYTPVDPLYAQF